MTREELLKAMLEEFEDAKREMENGDDPFYEAYKTDHPDAEIDDYLQESQAMGKNFYETIGETIREDVDEMMDYFGVDLDTALLLRNHTSAWAMMKIAKGELTKEKLDACLRGEDTL